MECNKNKNNKKGADACEKVLKKAGLKKGQRPLKRDGEEYKK